MKELNPIIYEELNIMIIPSRHKNDVKMFDHKMMCKLFCRKMMCKCSVTNWREGDE